MVVVVVVMNSRYRVRGLEALDSIESAKSLRFSFNNISVGEWAILISS